MSESKAPPSVGSRWSEAPLPPGPHLAVLAGVVAAGLGILVVGLAWIQLRNGAKWKAAAERQAVRIGTAPAPRGQILDRDGRVLATSVTSWDAVLDLGALYPAFRKAEAEYVATVAQSSLDAWGESFPRAQWLHLQDDARRDVIERAAGLISAEAGRSPADHPAPLAGLQRKSPRIVVLENINASEKQRLEALAEKLPALRLVSYTNRHYPKGSFLAHVLGYVRTAPEKAWSGAPDYTGISGIEKAFDRQLRGAPGKVASRRDAKGFSVSALTSLVEPIRGSDVVLSIDSDLQDAAEQNLRANTGMARGAAVALDVQTGEVLALASLPDFSPERFLPELSPRDQAALNASGAWLNVATQGAYPPGSAFKPFTFLAGLRRGTLTPATTYRCFGYVDVSGIRIPCHHRSGHGELSLFQALSHSCNVYAILTGTAAGYEALVAEEERFHFHQATGIELPGEHVPRPLPPFAGGRSSRNADAALLSIGQGRMEVSPLQMACAIASLARGERYTAPTLLKAEGRSPSGTQPREPIDLPEASVAAVIQGMREVISIGIGQDVQVPGVTIAGKTGTAQIKLPSGTKNIAWFVAFAPVDQPRISVAVAMEGRVMNVEYTGAHEAAPVVREIIGRYFDKHGPPTRSH